MHSNSELIAKGIAKAMSEVTSIPIPHRREWIVKQIERAILLELPEIDLLSAEQLDRIFIKLGVDTQNALNVNLYNEIIAIFKREFAYNKMRHLFRNMDTSEWATEAFETIMLKGDVELAPTLPQARAFFAKVVRGILANKIRAIINRRNRIKPLLDDVFMDFRTSSSDENSSQEEYQAKFEKLIENANLNYNERIIIILTWHGMKAREIARLQNLSIKYIRVIQTRARKKLRNAAIELGME